MQAGDPVELASYYSKQGADEIVFLDITATVEARKTVADVVRRTVQQVFVPVTVGGGIRTLEDFQELLRAGADKISVNSAAVKDPDLISRAAERFRLPSVSCWPSMPAAARKAAMRSLWRRAHAHRYGCSGMG